LRAGWAEAAILLRTDQMGLWLAHDGGFMAGGVPLWLGVKFVLVGGLIAVPSASDYYAKFTGKRVARPNVQPRIRL
jgi:hypothetical protein